jgi:hypothetical protein
MKKLMIVFILACSPAFAQTSRPTSLPASAARTGAAARPAQPQLRDDAPDSVKMLWTNREKARAEQLKKLTAALPKQQAAVRAETRKEDKALQQSKLDKLRAEINETRTTLLVIPKMEDIKVGQIGYLMCDIEQVISDSSVRVEGHVLNIYDRWDNYVLSEPTGPDLLVSGYSTEGVTDHNHSAVMTLIITGTTSYETALGAKRTIFKAERFKIEDYLK